MKSITDEILCVLGQSTFRVPYDPALDFLRWYSMPTDHVTFPIIEALELVIEEELAE